MSIQEESPRALHNRRRTSIEPFVGRSRVLFRRFGRGLSRIRPTRLVLLGYLSYILIGWLLLCAPFASHARAGSALDHLFTAASAVSTTGLTTIGTSDSYTWFGEFVVLVLIQLGGVGYMTVGSFIIIGRTHHLEGAREEVAKVVFSLPEGFGLRSFVRQVVIFTLVIESLGAAALYPILLDAGDPSPLWSAVFHSVSAFCTAGFSLYGASFESFASNFWLNLVISILSILGAVGFIVCADLWNVAARGARGTTLTTRIILWFTFWLIAGASLILFVCETSLSHFPAEDRMVAACFQALSASTTVGFNTVPIGGISRAGLLVLIILMVIGASPSGTGGGLKVTTVSAMFGYMRGASSGSIDVSFWGRIIPRHRLSTAVANVGFYFVTLTIGSWALLLAQPSLAFDQALFEATSALGTVGLSMGVTGSLGDLGKWVLIILMYVGRVGPLTLGVALMGTPEQREPIVRAEDLAV